MFECSKLLLARVLGSLVLLRSLAMVLVWMQQITACYGDLPGDTACYGVCMNATSYCLLRTGGPFAMVLGWTQSCNYYVGATRSIGCQKLHLIFENSQILKVSEEKKKRREEKRRSVEYRFLAMPWTLRGNARQRWTCTLRSALTIDWRSSWGIEN